MSSKTGAFLVAALMCVFAGACSHVPSSGGSGSNGASSGGTGGTGGGTTATFTIGGKVVGLTGTGLVLENNGTDDLTITGTGTVNFTFKTAVSGAYKVLVKTQPSSPIQNCSVTNGTGTATANVTNIQVTCGAAFTVGGAVSGLVGTGLVLQDNGGDNLSIKANGNFTFPTPLAAGSAYTVTILTEPTVPAQSCTVVNGTGTATANISNVQIICPQPSFSISGSLIGLVSGTGDTVELQNNAGDDLFVTGNNQTFTFPTQVTNGGIYNVTVFLEPTSQPQPCNVFNGSGVAMANVSNIIVDCQHNDWAWVSGSTTFNQYAAVSLPPPNPDLNSPGGRDFASTWTDKSGRKWLFGGFGYPLALQPPQPTGLLNDLWVWEGAWVPANLPIFIGNDGKYHADTTPLTLTDTAGSYGTVGSAGTPGSRWGGVSWTDASGNLWMFGGQGYDSTGIAHGLLNDTWKFVPGTDNDLGTGTFTGQWTWQGGPSTFNHGGVYGTLGVASASNIPGGRWAAAYWADSSGNVWLFGGQGYDSLGNEGLLNDLWEYNISTGQWTWMGGSNLANQKGIYGTQGTAAAVNVPGGRQAGVLWVDTAATIWLFGGFGMDSAGTPSANPTLNDLWKFQGGQWTWVSGGNLANQNGVYGTQLVAAASNVPGSRWGPVGWTGPTGNLWLFGGWGYDSTATHGTGFLNDVWEYNVSAGQWTWWKGSSNVNQNGAYVTHLSFVDNVAGARRGTSRWLPDSLGYVWMFGGQGYDASSATGNGYLNDLWTYLPYP